MSDRWSEGIRAGSVDVSIPVLLRDVDDNLEVTGKVFGDVTASYWRQGGTRTAISAVTLAAVDSAHSDGGFKEVDATNQAGLYRFDLPDAAVASGADWVVVSIKVTGCYVFHERFALTSGAKLASDALDAVLIESGISAGAGLTNDTGTQLTSINARQALALIQSACAAVLAGAGTGTVTIKPGGVPAGNTRISATTDGLGNRSAVTLKVPD